MMSRAYRNKNSAIRKITAVCTIIAVAATTFAAVISAQSMKTAATKSTAKLTQDQRILHVLNRLGFGARPGDVERVKAMGVDKYIELQLSPDRIDDAVSEAKLQNLETLRMPTAELYEKYPQPGQLLKQLQKRNDLPADLAAARNNRVKGGANTTPNQQKPGESMSGEMAAPQNNQALAAANPEASGNPMNNAEYR